MTGSRDVPDFIDLTQGVFPPPRDGAPIHAARGAESLDRGARRARQMGPLHLDVTFYHSELQDEL